MRKPAMLLLAPMMAACNPGPNDRADAQPPRAPPPYSVARLEGQAAPNLQQPEKVERGRERYAIFCSPCHGDSGRGDGTAVSHGFPAPPSFHESRARDLDQDSIIAIIAEGRGRMLPMAERIAPADRRAIAAYVKALQLGQDSPAAASPGAELSR